MAASSGDDIPTQLATLLGYPVKRIRITDEEPPRISVIDLATAITKKDANHAAQDVGYVKERHPEVTQILGDFKSACGTLRRGLEILEKNSGILRRGLEILEKNSGILRQGLSEYPLEARSARN